MGSLSKGSQQLQTPMAKLQVGPSLAGLADSRLTDLLLWRRPVATLVMVCLGAAAFAAGEFALRGGHSLMLLTGETRAALALPYEPQPYAV